MFFGQEVSFIRKYRWLILVLILVVIGVVAFFMFDFDEKSKNSTQFTTEFIFKGEGKPVEIRVNNSTKETILYVGNKAEQTLSFVPRKADEVIVLPETDKKVDIVELREPVSELTWDSTLEESASYLNFLDSEGYDAIREAHTSSYIEIVLEKRSQRKRLIIFNNMIMVGDLSSKAKLPELKDYMQEYQK